MAWNDNGQPVGSNGLCDGANRHWCADALGNLRITGDRADWDLSKSLPDSALKNGSAEIERQIQTGPRRLDETDYLGNEIFEIFIAGDQVGLSEIAWRDLFVSAAGSSPKNIAQTPCSEAATRIDPSEHLPTAKRITAPLPPFW